MALGIKKITESVIEEGRALTTIGTFFDANENNKEGKITVNDNLAIDPGGLFTYNSLEGGIIRMKVAQDEQIRINADQTLYLQSVTTRVIKDQNITTEKIKDAAVTTAKIKDRNVTSNKIALNAIKNEHLNKVDASDADRTVHNHNIKNGSITTEKIANGAVTSDKLAKDSVLTEKIKDSAVTTDKIKDNAVTFDKLGKDVQNRIIALESKVVELEQSIKDLKNYVDKEFAAIRLEMAAMKEELKKYINTKIEEFKNQYKLQNAVVHNGSRSVGKKHGGGSTELIDLHCTGNIEGNRVYYMTYQDLAEAYMPGEHVEPGDIVAMREDGLVYKANAFDQCIVGVVSDEFANCLGATIEEIEKGWKVAVGTVGKVHVNVRGPVKLGQKIQVVGADLGIGNATWTSTNNIGKSLETIECGLDEVNKVLVQIRPM